MSVGLLYRYVQSKEEILLLILDEIMSQFEADLAPVLKSTTDPVEQIKSAIAAFCRAIDRNRSGALLAYQATAALAEPRRAFIKAHELATHSMLVSIIEAGVAAGVFRSVDAKLLAYNIIMGAHAWALKRWYLQSHYSLEAYIAAQTELVLQQLLGTSEGGIPGGTPAGRARTSGPADPESPLTPQRPLHEPAAGAGEGLE